VTDKISSISLLLTGKKGLFFQIKPTSGINRFINGVILRSIFVCGPNVANKNEGLQIETVFCTSNVFILYAIKGLTYRDKFY
jgi:hypothetical protein